MQVCPAPEAQFTEYSENDNTMELKELGKMAVIDDLYRGSGFTRVATPSVEGKAHTRTSHALLLEGVDFDLTYFPLRHLGYKAVLRVIGPLYAVMHKPVSLHVVVAMSNRFGMEDVKALWEGVTAAAKEHSVSSLSFDLQPSAAGLALSLSAAGTAGKDIADKAPKPKSMDLICLSGNVGAAYMGLQVLEREKAAFNSRGRQPDLSKYKYVLSQYLSPEIKNNVLSRMKEGDFIPSCGVFSVNGLGAAVLDLQRATGLGAKIYIDKIPISSKTFEMAEELSMDPITCAINGGEDYRLLFTLPIACAESFRRDFQDWDIIGHLAQTEVGTVIVTPEGTEFPIKAQGY